MKGKLKKIFAGVLATAMVLQPVASVTAQDIPKEGELVQIPIKLALRYHLIKKP